MDAFGNTIDPASPDMPVAPGALIDTAGLDVPAAAAAAEPSDKALVTKIIKTIRQDKEFHEKAFKRMKRDMHVARIGAQKEWDKENYVANICGRHVKQKTNALYAKNPKATARRKESLDFAVWDENPDTLKIAMADVQTHNMAVSAPPQIDPATGQPAPPQGSPVAPDALAQAQAVVQDYQTGQQRRTQLAKMGKTLEILFSYSMREQKPLDFKMGMKRLVRRACTTGVGYVELGFQREMGPRPGLTEQLTDARTRLDHLENLAKDRAEGDISEDDAEMAELRDSMAALQAEPEIVMREGLIVDFPVSTKVIPDKLCKSLVGFIGARHLTIEYLFTVDEVEEIFGVDLDGKFKRYNESGKAGEEESPNRVQEDYETNEAEADSGLVCVWKHYDKPSGLMYFVADGYDKFLRQPASPDVLVGEFWPVYALTFNEVENEDELFPVSDVGLILKINEEYNRSRQGMREHRQAARPRWAYSNGQFDNVDIDRLKGAKPFEAFGLSGLQPGQKITDLLQPVPVPGVDPNLYETNQLLTDMQLVVGTSEAVMGGMSKATATESAISANSTASSDSASVDDLDAFLTCVARGSGQILLREMSQEQVMKIVGPGATWPQLPLEDIANELYLETAAASTGKPNQAVEINNWKTMLPFLIQMPDVNHNWLARETIRRLDDDADLTEALAANIPSIVAKNQMAQPATGDPATNPASQGAQGGTPPAPQQPGGSGPAFGSNQVHGGGA